MVFQNQGVFGVVQKDRKEVEENWFPSLSHLAGQTLTCSMVEAVLENKEASDVFWESEKWKEFRKYFHEVQYYSLGKMI